MLSPSGSATVSDTVNSPPVGEWTVTISAAGVSSAVKQGYAVVITGDVSEAAPCPADLNGDGLVDFTDYLEFLDLYDAGC